MEMLKEFPTRNIVIKRSSNRRQIEKLTYSVTEAALAITTNPQNVKDLIDMGYLGCLRIGETRIPKAEVQRFLDNHMNEDLASEIARYREEKKK
ncbi:DNA-binding protein [Enterococcus faecium]|nr:DNA-binding protein [Enterococcus faecium]NTK14489.1 DNA-binding protein [Enterococcus faecium]